MKTEIKNLGSTDVIAGRRQRLSALDTNPATKAVVSKLVEGLGPRRVDTKGNRLVDEPSQALMERISTLTATNIQDAESIYQLLPDITLAEQILVSSILSPNDMITTELNFYVDGKELDGEFSSKMISVIEDYFENTYKIKKLLPTMLSEVLFTKGSYPMCILPESSIDDAINSHTRVSQESLTGLTDSKGFIKNIGILGSGKEKPSKGLNVSFESIQNVNPLEHEDSRVGNDPHLFISDNYEFLKYPLLHDKISQDKLNDVYSLKRLGLETYRAGFVEGQNQLTDLQVENSLYRRRLYKHIPVQPIRTLDELGGETIGHPLVMTLPPESVIPVHVPGNSDEHVGYFILLDETGYPVSKASYNDYYADLASNLHQNKEMTSQLLAMTSRATYGSGYSGGDSEKLEVEEIVKNYSDMVEADLISRLKNGVYGENVKVAKPTEVYRIMLARTLSRQQTRMLYVPSSLMTYVAFDYNGYGVGKSLLEDTKIIGSIRAMLLFANTMAAIKNSVGRVTLNIELDEHDQDPGHTVEALVGEYARTRQRSYPIGASNPLDLVDYLQGAGVEVAVTGNPGYPDTKMSVEDYQSSKAGVDSELDENLKKRHIAAFGLAPESVDMSMNVDFATSLVNSNIQLTKRVMIYQDLTAGFLQDFVAKYVQSSQHLMDKLRDIIKASSESLPENLKTLAGKNPDQLIIAFLERLKITLPEPDTVKLENQLEAYTKYSEGLDAVMDAYISSEWMDSSALGDIADSIDTVVGALKAYFKRQWLRNNNVMPELEALILSTDGDDESSVLIKANKKHFEAIQKSLKVFMKDSIKNSTTNNKEMETEQSKIEAELEGSDSDEEEV